VGAAGEDGVGVLGRERGELGQRCDAAGADEGVVTAFWTAVYRSYLVILFLEIGDRYAAERSISYAPILIVPHAAQRSRRTFFIAALMSAKHPPTTVFVGAFGALLLMTVLSTALGVAAPLLLPHSLTHWAGAVLFIFFGLQMLHKAYKTPPHAPDTPNEELEEVEGELKEESHGKRYGALARYLSPVLVQTFVMTFLAEWGDRSQIATITMGADYEPVGICVGGSAGHASATLLAVLGGRYLAANISERAMSFAGGATFLLFGVVACFEDPSTDITQRALPSWMSWAHTPRTGLVDALR
jgi:putative Ca2+/H+ antiporter (TMEM165/GDT1 family)